MPDLNEIIKKRDKKAFNKKTYRPWDLSGDQDTPQKDQRNISEKQKEPKRNQLDTVKEPKRNQLDTVKEPKRNQLDTVKEPKRNQLDTVKEPKRNQLDTVNDVIPDTANGLSKLITQIQQTRGLQEKILHYVFTAIMLENSPQNDTGPIETEALANNIGVTKNTLKTALVRLVNKGLIERRPGKRARGGYLNLSIPEDIKIAYIELNKSAFRGYVDSKNQIFTTEEKQNITPNNMFLLDTKKNIYSSSNNNINTTINLPDEWKAIDFEKIKHVGFSQTQLKQLVNKNTPEIVQESINHLAYAIEHTNKLEKYDDPLNVIMGVLRKGQAWVEPNYRSPKEIAQAELLERKKSERQRLKKLESEALKMAFNDWYEELSKEQQEKILSKSELKKHSAMIPLDKLSLYFKDNVWQSVKSEYLLGE